LRLYQNQCYHHIIMIKFSASVILLLLVIGCTNDTSEPICIDGDASFSYSNTASYLNTTTCRWNGSANLPNPVPEFPENSKAGIFTADPEGLIFADKTTGEIDLLASVPGVYSITNTLNDECGTRTAITSFELISPAFSVEEVIFNGLVTMYFYRIKDVETTPELKDDTKYDIHWYHITAAGEIVERTDIGMPSESFGLSGFGHFITPDPQTGTTRNTDALVVEVTNLVTGCVTRQHFGKPLSELPEPGRSF
jgi:hypothetical protein